MLLIGGLRLSLPLVLAPLAGISDLPFRTVNRAFGAELAFTEMISARSLIRRSRKTERMLESDPPDRPLGVQLLGNEADILKTALEMLSRRSYDIVDFNAACPVTKVVARGEGAALLRQPRRLHDLLRVIVRHSSVPVTVKIRSGWDDSSVNAPDVALYAEDAGVHGVFIHGRTKMQGYGGTVDYAAIRSVKKRLHIPVIASGDALSPALIMRLFDETGCDGVVVARGALGNPWIFREAKSLFEGKDPPPRPDQGEVASTMSRHLALCCGFYGDGVGTVIFRKFFAWYTRGLRNTKPLREKAFHVKTASEMFALCEEAAGAAELLPDSRSSGLEIF